MALASGSRIGAYEVTAQIGVGGMGEVYRVPCGASARRRKAQYDVTPDGQRFLVNVPAEDTQTTSITVVLNWAAGLGASR